MGEPDNGAAWKGSDVNPGGYGWDGYGANGSSCSNSTGDKTELRAAGDFDGLDRFNRLAIDLEKRYPLDARLAATIGDMRAQAERLQQEAHAGTGSSATVEELEKAIKQKNESIAETSMRIEDVTIRMQKISQELDQEEELLTELRATRAQLHALLVEVRAKTPSSDLLVSTIVEALGPCLPPGEEWQRIASAWAVLVVRVKYGQVVAAPASSSAFDFRTGEVGVQVKVNAETNDKGVVRYTIAAKRSFS